jgi:hypothetical protein
MRIKCLIFLITLLSVASFGADADSGARLFEGSKPFKNGGVACIACHNVNSPKIISGGKLAKDLTMYGGESMAPTVGMMITSSEAMPSPLMTRAYKGHEITKEESDAIVEFFKSVNPKSTDGGTGNLFWLIGLLGAGSIFGGLVVLGKNKTKSKSVNQAIFDRQLKTKWRA